MKILRGLIEGVLGVDVRLDKSRRRHVVNARLIYSQILKEEGLGCTQVARSLRKDHATVLHYFKVFDAYVQADKILSDTYNKIKEMFETESDMVPVMSGTDLKKEVYTLRNEIKRLTSDKRKLISKLTERRETQERLREIFSLIKERTREGSENEILKKLNTFYNGVYDY
jgi:predicted RNase H-like nuclease (RuvC/YqgF family)